MIAKTILRSESRYKAPTYISSASNYSISSAGFVQPVSAIPHQLTHIDEIKESLVSMTSLQKVSSIVEPDPSIKSSEIKLLTIVGEDPRGGSSIQSSQARSIMGGKCTQDAALDGLI
jgi:hypothetical protein